MCFCSSNWDVAEAASKLYSSLFTYFFILGTDGEFPSSSSSSSSSSSFIKHTQNYK